MTNQKLEDKKKDLKRGLNYFFLRFIKIYMNSKKIYEKTLSQYAHNMHLQILDDLFCQVGSIVSNVVFSLS